MKHRLALAAGLLATLGACPAPALAADPTMPLADVRSGMRCTALSVVRGTTISEFDAEVIDVVRGESASSGPRILVRVSGPAVDATGIGPGFSGSPILCPDSDGVRRNAGAISETVGEYAGKMALATPIELVLGQGVRAPRSARRAPALMRSARRIATPLTISGLSGEMRRRVTSGRAAGGPAGPGCPRRAGHGLSRAGPAPGLGDGGELLERRRVHQRDRHGGLSQRLIDMGLRPPLRGPGAAGLLIQDAYVYSVVNNPVNSDTAFTYKLAVPGHAVGVLTNDFINGIVGTVGRSPRTIPLTVTVRDLDRRQSVSVRSRVTDERSLDLGSSLGLAASVGLGQALAGALQSAPPRLTASMCLRVVIRERKGPLGFCNDYVDGERPFEDLDLALVLIDAFKYGRVTPVSASVRMRVRRGLDEALMLSARAPRRARPGQRIPIRIAFRRRRAGPGSVTFRYRVPRSTRPGKRTLTLRGPVPFSLLEGSAESLEVLLEGGGGSGLASEDEVGPRSLDELVARIASLRRSEGVRATFARKDDAGPVVLPTRRLVLRGRLRIPIRVLARR